MKRILSLAAVALTALTVGAAAQTAPGAPTDVKNIGDFVVRCFPVKSPSPCDMYEERDSKDTRQRVLGFSLAFVPSVSRYAVQIAVPLGISIEKGLVIQTSSFTSPTLPYRRCDRLGCYVEMVMEQASIDSLTHSAPDAKIKIVADGGKSFDIPLSLNGFSEAHDAMAALARTKATTPANAPGAAAPAPAAPAK